MARKISIGLSLVAIGVLILHAVVLIAQSTTTRLGKYIPKAEIMKGFEESKGTIEGGQVVQIVPSLFVRRRLEGPNDASIHSTATDGRDVTEVMVVIDGSGTFMIGVTWVEKSDLPYKQRDRTRGISGGETHDVKAGDVAVIPPGTAHWFSKVSDHVTVIETRFPGNLIKDAK